MATTYDERKVEDIILALLLLNAFKDPVWLAGWKSFDWGAARDANGPSSLRKQRCLLAGRQPSHAGCEELCDGAAAVVSPRRLVATLLI